MTTDQFWKTIVEFLVFIGLSNRQSISCITAKPQQCLGKVYSEGFPWLRRFLGMAQFEMPSLSHLTLVEKSGHLRFQTIAQSVDFSGDFASVDLNF